MPTVRRWLVLRDLERRFSEWKERDRTIISDAGVATNDDVERMEASFLATGSPEAWRARVAEDVARPENNNARVTAHQPLDSQAKYR